MKNTGSSIESISQDENTITNSLDIANAFDKFFLSVGPKLAKTISTQIPSYLASQTQTPYLIPTTVGEVEEILSQLKDSAAGEDNIKPRVLEEVAQYIAKPTSEIIYQYDKC